MIQEKMISENDTGTTIAQRIECLERSNRRLRNALLSLCMLIGGAGIGGFILGDRILRVDKIETEELVIRDKAGRARVRLDVTEDNDAALLRFYNRDTTKNIVALGVSNNQKLGGLMLYDSKGIRKLILTNERDTVVTLSMANPRGDVSASILSNGYVNTIIGSTIVLANPKSGKPRAAFGVSDEVGTMEPYMDFYEESGMKRMGILMSQKGLTGLAFFDKYGKNRNFVGMKPSGEGYSVIADTSGKAEWKVP